MKRVLVFAVAAALLGVPAAAKKNSFAQQQQLLLLQQQQQAAAAAAAGGQTEAQREQAVRDAWEQQNAANALKMQQMNAKKNATPVYPAGQAPDVSGIWSSPFGATSFSLSPNGDGTYSVTGSWEQGWNKKAIFTSGKYVPNAHTMAVTYLMPWKNMSGTAQFTVAPSGTQLTGSWHQPDGQQAWTLTRMPGYQVTWLQDNRPSHRWPHDHLRIKDISGDWNSNMGPVSIDLDRGWNGMYSARGIWMQAPGGQRIRLRNGIYRPGPAPTLTFDYEQRWTRIQGSANLTLNPAGTELRGTFSEGGRTAPWVLNRAPGFVVQDL